VVLLYIFGLGEYDVDLAPLGSVSSLLDLGANIGVATLWLSRRLDGIERIACVEPAPESFRLLQTNLGRNVRGATAINAAVVAESGAYRLAEDQVPGLARVVPEEAGCAGSLEALTINELLDQADMESVDLLKIDIEGSELPIFERAGDWATRVGAILGEVHEPLTVASAAAILEPFGYEQLPVPDRPIFDDIILMRRSSAPAGSSVGASQTTPS
jgi:FkbM family methyltransferase